MRGRRTSLASVLGVVLVAGFVAVAVAGLLHGSPTALVGDALEPPSADHPFGTDPLGRDMLARTGAGAWRSVLISVVAVGGACAVAVPIGLVVGWHHGRRVDSVVMRIVESLQLVPPFVLALLLLGLAGVRDIELGPVTLTATGRLALALALGFVPFFTRIVRTACIGEVEEEYVGGLLRMGVSRREVLLGEVLPNVAPAVATQALLALAIAVFAEGGLGFVGMGVTPPDPALGGLVAEAGGQLVGDAWWFAFIPGLVLVAGITGLNLLSDEAHARLRATTTEVRP